LFIVVEKQAAVNVCLIEWAHSKPPTAKVPLFLLVLLGHRIMPWIFKAKTRVDHENEDANRNEYPPKNLNLVVVLRHGDSVTEESELQRISNYTYQKTRFLVNGITAKVGTEPKVNGAICVRRMASGVPQSRRANHPNVAESLAGSKPSETTALLATGS